MNQAWIGALSAVITGVLLLLGNRFVARQTREVGERQVEVEQRKVDQEAFDRFIARYEADRTRQDEELEETRTELRETRSLFRTALKHINLLRGEMRRREVPVPPLPDDLADVPWDMVGDQST
jgi:hypothetical protein